MTKETPAPEAPVVPTTPEVVPAPAETPPADNVPEWVKDPKQALAEIQKLRAENAEKRTKLTAIEQAAQAEADKKLAEEGKLKELLDKKTAELEATQKSFKTNAVASAITLEATRAGIADPKDALKLADLAGVAVSEDGTVTGAVEAIAALVAAKPYLITTPAAPTPAPALGATNPGADAPLTPDALRNMTQQQIAAMNPETLAAALRVK